jgi:hypothetical protein
MTAVSQERWIRRCPETPGVRPSVHVMAIAPSAIFRKALRMWLPRTAVSVDASHMVLLGNNMLTEVRQRLTQETGSSRFVVNELLLDVHAAVLAALRNRIRVL